ncbi:MAG: hypothetical protein ACXVGO_02585 [Mycobacterium sp.]
MSASTAEVPSRVEELTADWLSDVLGVGVEEVRVEQIAQDSDALEVFT